MTWDDARDKVALSKIHYMTIVSAQLAQVIQWTNKSSYRPHKKCVVLARIEYHSY